MPNLTAKYLSPEGAEVPSGENGELCLKGPSIFKGYWKNKEGTAVSFTVDGYYKTGDVGYHDNEENFYITDRVKELIKYKGFQVAPAGQSSIQSIVRRLISNESIELEGLLISHPSVTDVAVIGVDQEHTEVPRAYIVVPNGIERSPATANAIRTWMDAKMSSHKRLRGGIRFVDEIPKSAAGKILRRNLKDAAKQERISSRAKL
jgi:acyl-coenzyme A synthetase/AMP-(fatty) acid ligase